MGDEKLGVTMDANKFLAEAAKHIGSLIDGAKVNGAVIYNDTKTNVTFHVYNYIDIVYAIDAMRTLVAPGHCGTVAASGVTFKVHPDNNKDAQFLVTPGKAYVYKGPGAVVEAK